VLEHNHGRFERRALVTREITPSQLGLPGAAQLGCLHRCLNRLNPEAKTEIEWLVTSRSADKLPLEDFLNLDRNYWGVENGCHQRLDCSAFEDRLRVRHKGALKILAVFSRVGIALFIRWAQKQRRLRDRTYPIWREWNSGHRWHMIRQVSEPPG
jgi:hypothetical protein